VALGIARAAKYRIHRQILPMFGGLLLLSSHTTFPTAVEDMVMALTAPPASWMGDKENGNDIGDHHSGSSVFIELRVFPAHKIPSKPQAAS
jgi:hypothetical protein